MGLDHNQIFTFVWFCHWGAQIYSLNSHLENETSWMQKQPDDMGKMSFSKGYSNITLMIIA